MNKKEKAFYLAYIGTTKVAFLKAYKRPEKIEIVRLSAHLAKGFERGIVKDLVEASETLAKSVAEVAGEEKSIFPCRVVISNNYLKNYIYQSSIYFQGNPHPISLKDVRAAIAQTRSVATIPLQEVIVQSVPQEFLVNDLSGVQNPLGLEASRLGVTLRLLTLDCLVYNNLLRVFERCDLEISDIVPSFLSGAHHVLTNDEKQAGVILVLVGGGVTHFSCYKNSVLIETKSIALGADCITEVISKNLNVDYLDAQRLKENYGSAIRKTEFKDELIPIPNDEKKKRSIKRYEFEAQISTGLNHLLGEIKKAVNVLQADYAPLNQVVLMGGGACLDGFLEVVQENICPSARIATLGNVIGPETLISNPAFAAVLGGLSFDSRITEHEMARNGRQNWLTRTVDTARNWIFEYL